MKGKTMRVTLFVGVFLSVLDVLSKQDLNKSDKFWKTATQHPWRESAAHAGSL